MTVRRTDLLEEFDEHNNKVIREFDTVTSARLAAIDVLIEASERHVKRIDAIFAKRDKEAWSTEYPYSWSLYPGFGWGAINVYDKSNHEKALAEFRAARKEAKAEREKKRTELIARLESLRLELVNMELSLLSRTTDVDESVFYSDHLQPGTEVDEGIFQGFEEAAERLRRERGLEAQDSGTGVEMEEAPPGSAPQDGDAVDWGGSQPGEGSSGIAEPADSEPSIPAIDPETYRGFVESLGLVRDQVGGVAAAGATYAFDAYAAAMENAGATGQFTMAGLGKTLKSSARQSLLSIGQQATAKGVFEVGHGIRALADDDVDGGNKHFAAAGQFFAVAALAGAGAGAIGAKGGGGKKKKRDEEVAPSGAGGSGGSRVIQRITVIGNPTDEEIEETTSKFRNEARS